MSVPFYVRWNISNRPSLQLIRRCRSKSRASTIADNAKNGGLGLMYASYLVGINLRETAVAMLGVVILKLHN
jgi:hypothetical protein